MTDHVFCGFGFGPIQGGLFINEAFRSGRFSRIVIAEIDQSLVDAVRAAKGRYCVNVAQRDGIDAAAVECVEMLNPRVEKDRQALIEALRDATEIVTSLPSVDFYQRGGASSVAGLIATGLAKHRPPATIIYTAENNNHAAEILERSVGQFLTKPPTGRVRYLNTVIGKMSQVVADPAEIDSKGLRRIAPGIERAFLVEAFNKILVTRCRLDSFKPGIDVFIEKDDLLPFEEAKLYGHNAIHALLAYLGAAKGCLKMAQLADDATLMAIGRRAFIDESGVALIKKYAALHDALFTPAGYREFAEDLLERMVNPWLGDTIARAGRDPVRKLGYDDRIFGTMRLAMQYGIEPVNMALGAAAGLISLVNQARECRLPENLRRTDWRSWRRADIEVMLQWLWRDRSGAEAGRLIEWVVKGHEKLGDVIQAKN
jgi:mannitol-1-phosphate 5-dehydrogenase